MPTPTEATGSREQRQESFRKKAAEIQRTNADGFAELQKNVARSIREVTGHVPPGIVDQLAMAAARRAAYLGARLPAPRSNPSSLTPHLEQPAIDDDALREFALELAAVDFPEEALAEEIADGRLRHTTMRAIRETAPDLFAQLQQQVIGELARRTEPLPYERRVQLGILFDVPTDPTLEPGFVATIQQT